MDAYEYENALANLLGDLDYSYETMDGGYRLVTIKLDGRPNWMPVAWQEEILEEEGPYAAFLLDILNNAGMNGVIIFEELESPDPTEYRTCALCLQFLVNDDEQQALHELECE
jgi:hypothetical protein